MIPEEVEKEMNNQIREEMFSAYLYFSMAADFEDKNLPGFAHWMYMQAQEEMFHAFKFYNHIQERGGKVVLQPIGQPQSSWNSVLEAFEDAYKHEQHITARINTVLDAAEKAGDRASFSMLQWFIDEQVEEEATADENVQLLRMIGDNGMGLIMRDKEMAARTVTVPIDLQKFYG